MHCQATYVKMRVADAAFNSLEAALVIDDVVDALPEDSMLDLVSRDGIEQLLRGRLGKVL